MNIAIICLAVAFAGVLIWCYHLNGQVDELIDMMTDMAMHVTEREDWENKTFEKHDRRVEAVEKENEAIKNLSERLEAVNGELRTITDKMKEFDGLSADSLRAQIKAEEAWADGVRAIAGYGMNVPKIDTRGLSNE